MDTLFHFIFPIIAALAARLNIKHPVKTILGVSFFALFIDLDHFIPGPANRALFHNIFVTLLIPLLILFLAFHFKLSRYKKGLILLVLIFMTGHLFMDMFSNVYGEGIGITETKYGVGLFYPLSNAKYFLNFNIKIPLITSDGSSIEGYLVSSLGFGILAYFIIIIVPCLFLDDIIDITEKKHESFRKASKEFFKKLLKD
jgi:membrane-bound metal-dependent hydrolase YbcI (DUF457 family)